jgi:hypothetical protein
MKHKLIIFLLVLLSLFGVKALFNGGFYTSHDGRHQIVRLAQFHRGLVDGQLPVRWAGTAFNGFGYPLYIFTYRLPFWLAEGWYLISRNLVDSIKFVFIVTYVFSGLSMYWLSYKLWASKLSAFISSVLYLWAPYRFSNIFVRASLGEATTFVFIPLFYLGVLMLADKSKKKWLGLAITSLSLAGIILSHSMVMGLWFVPFLAWLIINYILTAKKKVFIEYLLLSGILALLLTAYYWLPAAMERQSVKFSTAIGEYYKTHFVTIKQLLYSKWGYGFDMPGTANDMMSFQVGMAQWLVIGAGFITLLILIIRRKKYLKNLKSTIFYLTSFLFIFLFSIYASTSASTWLYPIINKVMVIDIPWRLLGVTVFSASISAGGLIILLKNKLIKWGIIILTLFLAFYGNRNHLKVNQYTYFPDFEYWQDQETTNEYDDYAPKWFVKEASDDQKWDLRTTSGSSNNNLLVKKSNYWRFYSEVSSPQAEVRLHLAYYPGWQILLDGQPQNLNYENGKIKINLEKGNHLITLIFRETRWRLFANWLSLTTIVVIIIIYSYRKYVKK